MTRREEEELLRKRVAQWRRGEPMRDREEAQLRKRVEDIRRDIEDARAYSGYVSPYQQQMYDEALQALDAFQQRRWRERAAAASGPWRPYEELGLRGRRLAGGKRVFHEEQIGDYHIVLRSTDSACQFSIKNDRTGWHMSGGEPGRCSNALAAARRIIMRRRARDEPRR